MDASGYHGNYLHRVVGGVELEVKFAHHNDREKVIHAGRNVGWSPVDVEMEDEEEWLSDGELMVFSGVINSSNPLSSV